MTPLELLAYLRKQGVQLWAEGDRLRFSAPSHVLTLELHDQLAKHKTEILSFLQKADAGVPVSQLPIVPVPRTGDLPLSFSQQRLWFHDQLAIGTAAYNLQRAVRIKGPLNPVLIEQSLNEIVRRHESLRTNFLTKDGRLFQVVNPPRPLEWSIVDLREHLENSDREAAVDALLIADVERSFDLEKDPLFRAKLLRLGHDDFILILTMHHIVTDGWSIGVIFRELGILYEAFATGKPSPLPELSVQYTDFANWQRGWLQGEVLEEQLRYWKEELAGAPAALEIPTDRPRPAFQTFRSATEFLQLPKRLSNSLEDLSRREGVTLYMTLLAAFFTLLHRYSSQEDIVIGTPIAGRVRIETEQMVGLFLNTLPLRADFSGNPTFREFLNQVRKTALDAYAHQDIPFEKLVDELQPERDPSRTPLYQVLFNLHNFGDNRLKLTGFSVEHLPPHQHESKFDMTLIIRETENGLNAQLGYNADLFDTLKMARLLEHYQVLLEAIAASAAQRISTLPILTEAERSRILVEWNQTEVDYPRDVLLHQLIEAQVERTPDVTAIVFQHQRLTYRELNLRANQVAHYLRRLGVKRDTLVGLHMERSLEMVVALLGILKAGGAYVPLDPTFPKERLAYMLEDCGAKVLLTQASLGEEFSEDPVVRVCLDTDWKKIGQESSKNPFPAGASENLAYVIYTSGSTGKPKGVMIPHRAVVNFLASMQEEPGLKPDDVLLAVTTLSFDIAGLELYLPLTTGARVVFASQAQAIDAPELAKLMVTSGTTIMQATPTTWRMLLDSGWTGRSNLKILCGGESLPKDLAQQLLPKCASLWNLYGPTETTIWSTLGRVKPDDSMISIGRPIANTQIYILDERMHPVPSGVTGNLYIGGDGLARGYLNRPELTIEKFFRNPFLKDPETRLYDTGDLARYLPDGRIEHLGRRDYQVKLRGFRIELGEIETMLRQHEVVHEAVVMVREDTPGDQRLVAYVVCKGRSASVMALREFLKRRLPEYMVPAAFVFLDSLPLTPNGKVDRRALPAPEVSRDDLGLTYVAPRTPEEKILADVWSQVLHLDRVGIRDNYFALGGDSIRSIQIRALAEGKGLPLSFRQIFLHQTIEELAKEVKLSAGSVTPSPAGIAPFSLVSPQDLPNLPSEIDDAYPLTALQAGMIYHSELRPDTAVYHFVRSYNVRLPFDLAAWESVLVAMATEHPILRTSFHLAEFSEPLQIVHKFARMPFVVADLRGQTTNQQNEAIKRWIEEEKNHPFEWSFPPLARFQAFLCSDDEFRFVWSFHHAILDGWSEATLITQLFQRYLKCLARPVDVILSAITSRFSECVALEKEATESEEMRQYWMGQVNGSNFTTLPRYSSPDRIRGTRQIGYHKTSISSKTTSGLQDLAQSANASLKSVLMAAHLRVVSLLSNQTDVVAGFVFNSRPEEEEGERVLGLFLNSMPLRMKLEGSTWRDLIKETFRKECEMLPYRRYPLAALQKDMEGQVLFETLFNFVNFHVLQSLPAGNEIRAVRNEFYEETNFPLVANFIFDPVSNHIILKLSYDATEFGKAQMDAIAGYYLKVLSRMTANPLERYESVSLLSDAEAHQLLNEWNQKKSTYPIGRCIHQEFEAQVEQTPDAVAVVFNDQQMTYHELNRRANQVAHFLKKVGAGPEVLVGIFMERSLEMVIALVGILKAGGAYLPLEPAYPKERLAFMLEDAKVPVILTQQSLLGALPKNAARIITLDEEQELFSRESTDNVESGVKPEHLAYVIYTSGSTGKPKGTLVTHANVARLFKATQDWFHFGATDVWTLFHSHAFDFSVWELWGALSYGGRLVVVPYLVSRSPDQFYELLAREKVTVLNQTPSAFRQLIQAEQAVGEPKDLALRYVIFGGEALEMQSLKPWFERHGDQQPRLINMYGITETTVHVTYRPLSAADLGSSSVIGVPIPDLQVYILDAHRQLVPIGVPGEMYVGGAGVARGYLNRPELTAERFVEDCFADKPGARLYRSGDLARYLPNRDIEYLGRIDHQVKIRGFRIELGEIEAVLSQHPAIREAFVMAREDTRDEKRLVAYLVMKNSSSPSTSELRNFIKEKLPDYMVPAAFVHLERLPLTPHGKVDRRALPQPDQTRPELQQSYHAPSNPEQEILAAIWSDVLRVDRVGINDNFFELGGDSILSIQVIARARQAGLHLTPKHLFQNQTIAELAEVVQATPVLDAEQGQAQGEVPLTPIQQWFFEQNFPELHHWNQSFFFDVQQPLDISLLEQAFHDLMVHHDSFRLRFSKGECGWKQAYIDRDFAVSVKPFDLAMMTDSEQIEAIRTITTGLQAHFDLARGPLVSIGYFNLGTTKRPRLFVAIHHLVVDGVSWRILIEDLENIYLRLRRGEKPNLHKKSSSYQQWAKRLFLFTKCVIAPQELDYWLAREGKALPRIPIDFESNFVNSNLEGSVRAVNTSLTPEETKLLLQQVPSAYKTQINDVLLTALLRAFTRWTGKSTVHINLEGHGREDLVDGVDLSRTVGWFTSIFPVELKIDRMAGPGESLKSVKEQLRTLPHRGIGYGLLRYLAEDESTRESFRSLAQPEISFNYLGQLDQIVEGSSLFRFASESTGPNRGLNNPRVHLLDVVGGVSDGQLRMKWTYSEKFHRGETLQKLADDFSMALRELIVHCISPESGGFTPSDFPLASIDQQHLDVLVGNSRDVEDIYPLSPIQQLFYALEGTDSKIGFEQWHYLLRGDLDPLVLKQAWEQVIQRHSILRTAFEGEYLKEPLQIVHHQVEVPWMALDWRAVSETEKQEKMRDFIRADRNLGFDLSRPPLTRFALIRVENNAYHLLWSTHHLLIDGWSWPLVLREVSELYEAYCESREARLDRSFPYRNYIAWLQNHDSSEAEIFWRNTLQGFTSPTPLPLDNGELTESRTGGEFAEVIDELPEAHATELVKLAQRHQLTPGTIFQAAWALLLSHYSGRDDIVFGVTFSGRPAELPGVDSMIGPFVNNLPVRVSVPRAGSLFSWLRQLQQQQFEVNHYQHTPLVQIHEWSGLSWHQRLFESLLVFQNYLVDECVQYLGKHIEVSTLASPAQTNYPLTLFVVPGRSWRLKILSREKCCSRVSIQGILRDLKAVMDWMISTSSELLENLTRVLPPPPEPKRELVEAIAPGLRRIRSAAPFVPAGNEMERIVADVWKEAFQVEEVGMNDNFFDLGGHSLLMVRVHARLKDVLKRELSIVKMFQYPTINSLARYLIQEEDQKGSFQSVQDRAKRQRKAFARTLPPSRKA